MGMYDKSKFVFSETFNNSSGKTSGSGFIGVLLGMAAVAGIIAGIFGFFFEIKLLIEFLEKMIQVGGISALLLGVRKATSLFSKSENANEVKPPVTPPAG